MRWYQRTTSDRPRTTPAAWTWYASVQRCYLVKIMVICGMCQQVAGDEDRLVAARNQLVDREIVAAGIQNSQVIAAMRHTPRHEFVPKTQRRKAYFDMALPIGGGQTISPPYVVAYMTEALALRDDSKVLEIGTGSGYQAAILGEIAREVFTIEIVPELATQARVLLTELGYANIKVRTGDGYRGWPDEAPFDAIVVTAAPDHIPPTLVDQLAVGARLVIPVGRLQQEMTIVTKVADGVVTETTLPVRFVPMTGEAQQRQR